MLNGVEGKFKFYKVYFCARNFDPFCSSFFLYGFGLRKCESEIFETNFD